MLDLALRNGLVLDGTGRPAFRADVGVKDGLIVAVGDEVGPAAEEIDATGCHITPGFVDLHTHYDGQATWDDELAPSSWHGVTTAVMGSCGVGFAPVRPTDHAKLVELMEGVEDIPGTALHEGLPWTWETLPEYMDALDAQPHLIDLAVQVTHDPLRVYVMGDRAVANEPATAEDIATMARLVREAMEAGAVGFSTGRSDNHRSAKGDYTPASEATQAELEGLAAALNGLDHGVLQAVSDFNMNEGPADFYREFDLLEAMMAAAPGKPLSTTLLQRDLAPTQWTQILERTEAARARGLDLRVQVAPRPIGVLLGLQASFHPFLGKPSYQALAHLPLAERVARLRDPAVREAILSEETVPVAGEGSSIPKFVDEFLEKVVFLTLRMFRLGDPPNYEPNPADSLYAEAERAGRNVMEVVYEALLEDEGRALLYFPLFNYSRESLDDVRTMLTHPAAMIGLSDGGAHVGTICDASFPTTLLTHWVRDRDHDRLELPRVVQMLTDDPARYLGFTDRGRVAEGLRADLNVVDLTNLTNRAPALHADLPAGGHRLLQHAEGYRATIVHGQVVRRDGQTTEARPGRLVRLGQS